MAGLFLIYLICLLLMIWGKPNLAFGLLLINFILSMILFLPHTLDVLNIRL